jgi:hypothetical protein
MTLARIKIAHDDNLSDGDRKVFVGGIFCWISLLFTAIVPLHYNIDDKLVIFKVVFWIGGVVMAGIGISVLGSTDIAVSPNNGGLNTRFRASMQIIGLTLVVSLTASMVCRRAALLATSSQVHA